MVKDINPDNSGMVGGLVHFADSLYFIGVGIGSGYGLWKTDGTTAGTVMVKDPNPAYGKGLASALTLASDTLYFFADDNVHGTELWKSDGTEAGTMMVKDINPSTNPQYIYGTDKIRAVGDTLYFVIDDGAHGRELWKSDGTETGTVMLKDINPSGDALPFILYVANGLLYFIADDGIHGSELWKSDGTEAGTVMLKDINPSGDGWVLK